MKPIPHLTLNSLKQFVAACLTDEGLTIRLDAMGMVICHL